MNQRWIAGACIQQMICDPEHPVNRDSPRLGNGTQFAVSREQNGVRMTGRTHETEAIVGRKAWMGSPHGKGFPDHARRKIEHFKASGFERRPILAREAQHFFFPDRQRHDPAKWQHAEHVQQLALLQVY